MRISDWSSDVCSSDLTHAIDSAIEGDPPKIRLKRSICGDAERYTAIAFRQHLRIAAPALIMDLRPGSVEFKRTELRLTELNVSNDLRLIVKNGMPINDRTADNELRGSRQDRVVCPGMYVRPPVPTSGAKLHRRSEEHTSELQSLMRISYAVFCLKKKNNKTTLLVIMPIHQFLITPTTETRNLKT